MEQTKRWLILPLYGFVLQGYRCWYLHDEQPRRLPSCPLRQPLTDRCRRGWHSAAENTKGQYCVDTGLKWSPLLTPTSNTLFMCSKNRGSVKAFINISKSNNSIWWNTTGSMLIQVMAWCRHNTWTNVDLWSVRSGDNHFSFCYAMCKLIELMSFVELASDFE